MIFYLVCIAILAEFVITLGWTSVLFALVAIGLSVVLFRTRRHGWWRLPLAGAALAGGLASVYSFSAVAAVLTCALVFGVLACAWVAGHSSPDRRAGSHRAPRQRR